MGGGIIINRAAVLIPAVTDASFLNSMEASDKARIQAIEAKGAGACDEGDVRYMTHMLNFIAKHC